MFVAAGAGRAAGADAGFPNVRERAFEHGPEGSQCFPEPGLQGSVESRARRHVACMPYYIHTMQAKKEGARKTHDSPGRLTHYRNSSHHSVHRLAAWLPRDQAEGRFRCFVATITINVSPYRALTSTLRSYASVLLTTAEQTFANIVTLI